jgi:hypothetical protein
MTPETQHSRRAFVHVGAPKTGTTFLQNVFWQNRERLAEDGVLYPGDRPASHHQASLDLRGASFGPNPGPATAGAWDRLAAAARDWRGDVLVSSELLAWATPRQVDRALDSLDLDEVHVVMTLRDLRRQLPAVWQEEIKNRRVLDWPTFLAEAVRARADDAGPGGMWAGQDPRQVLGRWGSGLPTHWVHVVTLPPAGQAPGLLWDRFCSVLGIDPGRYDTEVRGSNVGIGLAEAELLRRVNLALDEELRWPQYANLVKHGIAESALTRTSSGKVALPEAFVGPVARRTRDIVDVLEVSRFDIVGDLADLDVGEGTAGNAPLDPEPEAMVDAAVATIVELLGQLAESRQTINRLRAARKRARRGGTGPESDGS